MAVELESFGVGAGFCVLLPMNPISSYNQCYVINKNDIFM